MEMEAKVSVGNESTAPIRKNLQEAAKTFKSNWVQFGELLTRTATEKQYSVWGFNTFEEYCVKELRIKKLTAMKLTNAYFFITKTDPKLLEDSEIKGVPDYEVVNFLHKTKEDENCSPEIYEELRNSAIEKGQTGKTLARRFKELLTPEESEKEKVSLDQSLSLVNRLQQKIKPIEDIPSKFVEYLDEIEDYLQQVKSNKSDT